jgi:hypothetical protein
MFHVHYVTIPQLCDNLRLKFAHPVAVGHECPSMSSNVFSENSTLLNLAMLHMKIGSGGRKNGVNYVLNLAVIELRSFLILLPIR